MHPLPGALGFRGHMLCTPRRTPPSTQVIDPQEGTERGSRASDVFPSAAPQQ